MIQFADDNILIEYNNTKNILDEAKEYMKRHPNVIIGNGPGNILDVLDPNSENFRTVKYKDGSSFRHKSGNQGLIRDFGRNDDKKKTDGAVSIQISKETQLQKAFFK